jgi:hypothetical protein
MQVLRVSENLSDEFECMNTQLNVLQKVINILQNNILIFSIVFHKLDQEHICLLNDLQVGIFVLFRLQLLLLNNLDRDVIRFEIAQQALILLIEDVIVCENAFIFVVPLLIELR